jgi:hypothetical protein
MTAEDVARRFERKPGYELIDYAPVALPLHRLTVDVVTMVHNPIPPIKEFAMRSIAAGLTNGEEISAFVGLDGDVISATLDQLFADHFANETEDGLKLTDRGHEVLTKGRQSSPQDEMQVFLYDRILQRPIRLTAEELIAPANLDLSTTVEIRPYPAEGPELAELSLSEVGEILQSQAGGRAPFGRDLLKLKRIVRRVRLFRSAIALIFRKSRSSEMLVEFVIDDVRQEALSHRFAERGGPKKMGFIKAIDESVTAAEIRKYLGPEVQTMLPDAAALESNRLAVSVARIKTQASISAAERSGIEDVFSAAPVISARALLEAAEDSLQQFAARPILPFELTELLEGGLVNANKRLLISSHSVDWSVVNSLFLERLHLALDRGVGVRLSLSEESWGANEVVADLERLSKKRSGLTFVWEKKNTLFHVICDDKFAVVANKPFLGNLGKVRAFQRVSGYLLQRAGLVDALAERVLGAALPKISPKSQKSLP